MQEFLFFLEVCLLFHKFSLFKKKKSLSYLKGHEKTTDAHTKSFQQIHKLRGNGEFNLLPPQHYANNGFSQQIVQSLYNGGRAQLHVYPVISLTTQRSIHC